MAHSIQWKHVPWIESNLGFILFNESKFLEMSQNGVKTTQSKHASL